LVPPSATKKKKKKFLTPEWAKFFLPATSFGDVRWPRVAGIQQRRSTWARGTDFAMTVLLSTLGVEVD
jgi:hypothetical protein